MGVEIQDTVLLVCNNDSSIGDTVSLILKQDVFPEAEVVEASSLNAFHPGVRIVRLKTGPEVERFIEQNRGRLLGVLVEENLQLGNGTKIAREMADSGVHPVTLWTVDKFVTTPAVTERGIDVLTPLEVPGVEVLEVNEGFAHRIFSIFQPKSMPRGSA